MSFPSENDLTTLLRRVKGINTAAASDPAGPSPAAAVAVAASAKNLFDERTDKWSAVQYFQFYSFLSQQQNMMQDFVRTATYQRSVMSNIADFKNKVVLDVGAGSGILSFFAIQGGAKKVYAVEASNMAEHCEALVMSNKLAGKIIVLPSKIEEVAIPELVDVIISEPMGYMLFNERMLESFVHARKFLRPGGKMFPSLANLYIAPFSDDALYMEQYSKANFWYQQNFHGVDLSALRDDAVKEYFRQPVVDTWDVKLLLAAACKSVVDFQSVSEPELCLVDVPLRFTAQQAGMVHGYAFWFDVGFLGSQAEVWLSTAPSELLTHWYQVRCLFLEPVFVTAGQQLCGRLAMRANARQSYDVDIEIQVEGSGGGRRCSRNTLDLKNPCFRYTGAPTQPPPGAAKCPTDTFWANILHGGQPAPQPFGATATASAMDTDVGPPLTSAVPLFASLHGAGAGGGGSAVSSQFMIGDYAAATTTSATTVPMASPVASS